MRAVVLELFPKIGGEEWARIARDLHAKAGHRPAFRFCREAARVREQSGQLEEARAIYRHMLRELAPGHAVTTQRLHDVERRIHVRYLRAEAPRARRSGDHDRALRVYLQLLALEPEDGFHPLRAGDCFARLGRETEASECYREAALRFQASGYDARARAVGRVLGRVTPPAPSVPFTLSERSESKRRMSSRGNGKVQYSSFEPSPASW
jgi:tetratricopeptide (TPR) repeat protein